MSRNFSCPVLKFFYVSFRNVKGGGKMAAARKRKGIDETPKQRPRIHTIDELRGFAIFCMIFFHAFYSIGYFFHWEWGIKAVEFFSPAEPFFAGGFIIISGIACNLSHSNLERGVKLALIAAAVTIVTRLVLGREDMIWFGILHMLACGMILYGLTNKYLKLIPSWLGILINVLLFIFTYNITSHTLGIPFLFTINLPDGLYSTPYLFMFGLPDKYFSSSDYFPLIPWMFLFFAGAFLGRIGITHRFPKFMFKKRLSFFGLMGRHSLLIYIAHQPVIFLLCYAVQGAMSMFTH